VILDGIVWSTLQLFRTTHSSPLSSVSNVKVDDKDVFIGGKGLLVDAWVDVVAPPLSTLLFISNVVEAFCDFDPRSLSMRFNKAA